VSTTGELLVGVAQFTSYGDRSGRLGPAFVVPGRTDTRTVGEPRQVSPGVVYDGVGLAMRGDGAALVTYEDFSAGAQRVRRREPGADFGPEQGVSCPRQLLAVVPGGIASDGTAALFVKQVNAALPRRGWFVTQDAEGRAPVPASCPTGGGKPYPTYSPNPVVAGQETTIDVEGSKQQEAPVNRWTWDLDGDGDFETDTGESPVVRKTWATAGEHRYGMRNHWDSTTGSRGSATWEFRVYVDAPRSTGGGGGGTGSGSTGGGAPPAAAPAPPPAPAPGPDPTPAPRSTTGDPPPAGTAGTAPSSDGGAEATPAPTAAPARTTPRVDVAPLLRLATAGRRGVRVRLSTDPGSSPVPVRLTLVADPALRRRVGLRGAGSSVLGARTVTARGAGGTAGVRLRPRALRALRRVPSATFTLRATARGRTVAVVPVTVRR
jgi:hypothetical protein